MRLNADLSARVVIDTLTATWTASPEPGVDDDARAVFSLKLAQLHEKLAA